MNVKTIHLSIIAILIISIVSSGIPYAESLDYGQHPQVQQIPSFMIQLSIPKFNFADGEVIPINGSSFPNSDITISLSDNLGTLENSTQVIGNNTGYFYTNLGIPSHVIGGGSWHILATSDGTFKSLQIMVNTHGMVTMPSNFPSGLSPLKQFKLGMDESMIQCHSDFQLMVKKENGQPECVKIESANKLFARDWGIFPLHGLPSQVSQKENSTLPASFMECDTPYPQSNTGVAVLYLPANSTGKICVQYSNSNPPQPTGIRIFEAHHIMEDTKDVTSYATPDAIPTGDSTIVYTITTGNHVGFYGLTVFCVGMPFVIGYDSNSTFVESDFPWIGGTYNCPAQLYDYHIAGLSGIGVKYIPYP